MNELGPYNALKKKKVERREMKDEEEREEKDKANFMTCPRSYS